METSATPHKMHARKSSGRKFKHSRTEIEHHDDGSHTISHHFKSVGRGAGEMGSYKEPDTSTAADNGELQDHMAEAFPDETGDAANPKGTDAELPE